MSEHGTGRFETDGYGGLSDADAERLLSFFDGAFGGMPAPVGSPGGAFAPASAAGSSAETVARVLAAAAAPPRPHELRGYEPVRRAYESGGARGRHVASLPLRRLAGVKLAALAGTLTVAGVAVAAEADVLPSPIQRVAHQMLGGIGVPEPGEHDGNGSGGQSANGPTDGGTSGGPNGSPTQHGLAGTASGSRTGGGTNPLLPTASADGSQGTLSADLIALCQAYDDHNGSALSGADRRRLATLAGGEKNITDFCARVLAAANANPGLPSTPEPTGLGTDPSTQVSPTTGPGTDPSHDHSHTTDPSGNGHSHTPNPTKTH